VGSAFLYFKAIGLGLAVAAPVGPMALLCMRRTLVQGWRHGLATGVGIAVGDGIYALVAALGLASVSAFVLAHERQLHGLAGIFLLYLGLKGLLARPKLERGTSRKLSGSWPLAFSSSVLLTLTNPPTIIMFAAIFAALAPASGFRLATAFLTVAGVLTGSLLWWCGVTATVSAFQHAIGRTARLWIDRVVGTILAIFGVRELYRAL
jgi:threonine/homoserine/homoserine lactone efflux protein